MLAVPTSHKWFTLLKPFYLLRGEDATGVSGTAVVAIGVLLPRTLSFSPAIDQ